jgi:hypothetical protein
LSLSETLGTDFPRRCIVTNLVAGALMAFMALMYFGPIHAAGFSVGLLLGTLHLWTWIGLGRQLVGEREGLVIAGYALVKVVGVYGGTLLFLVLERRAAAAFLIGFTLIFVVIVQKVLGRKLLASKTFRSVP